MCKRLVLLFLSTIPLVAGCFIDADDDRDPAPERGNEGCVTACATERDNCIAAFRDDCIAVFNEGNDGCIEACEGASLCA